MFRWRRQFSSTEAMTAPWWTRSMTTCTRQVTNWTATHATTRRCSTPENLSKPIKGNCLKLTLSVCKWTTRGTCHHAPSSRTSQSATCPFHATSPRSPRIFSARWAMQRPPVVYGQGIILACLCCCLRRCFRYWHGFVIPRGWGQCECTIACLNVQVIKKSWCMGT